MYESFNSDTERSDIAICYVSYVLKHHVYVINA